jgi:hypothetical protein
LQWALPDKPFAAGFVFTLVELGLGSDGGADHAAAFWVAMQRPANSTSH